MLRSDALVRRQLETWLMVTFLTAELLRTILIFRISRSALYMKVRAAGEPRGNAGVDAEYVGFQLDLVI